MNLAKRIRDLRYSKGWGPDELANRAKISRTALYQIERGNTSKPQAGTLRRISRALGVPLEILLDSTPVLSEQIPSSEGPAEGGSYSHAMTSGSLERSLSSDRADELIERSKDVAVRKKDSLSAAVEAGREAYLRESSKS